MTARGLSHRPPPAGAGKRGQQVRRWLERRGRRTVRPPRPNRSGGRVNGFAQSPLGQQSPRRARHGIDGYCIVSLSPRLPGGGGRSSSLPQTTRGRGRPQAGPLRAAPARARRRVARRTVRPRRGPRARGTRRRQSAARQGAAAWGSKRGPPHPGPERQHGQRPCPETALSELKNRLPLQACSGRSNPIRGHRSEPES